MASTMSFSSWNQKTYVMPWSLLWPASYRICSLVATTLWDVFVAIKSFSKWLQNLKDLWDCPQSLCFQGELGGQIKKEEQISWIAELVDNVSLGNPKIWEPYSLRYCSPFTQGSKWSGFCSLDKIGGTDFDFGNQCLLYSGELVCSLSLLFSICLQNFTWVLTLNDISFILCIVHNDLWSIIQKKWNKKRKKLTVKI